MIILWFMIMMLIEELYMDQFFVYDDDDDDLPCQHADALRLRIKYIVDQVRRMQCTQDMADRLVDLALEEYESALVMQMMVQHETRHDNYYTQNILG